MIIKEESTEIANLTKLGAGGLVLGCGHIVNMQYFFSTCLHYNDMDQTNYI